MFRKRRKTTWAPEEASSLVPPIDIPSPSHGSPPPSDGSFPILSLSPLADTLSPSTDPQVLASAVSLSPSTDLQAFASAVPLSPSADPQALASAVPLSPFTDPQALASAVPLSPSADPQALASFSSFPGTSGSVPSSEVDIETCDDIGLLLHSKQQRSIRNLSPHLKYTLLINHFRPNSGFKFPSRYLSGCNRACQHSYLVENPWFVYSKVEDGIFCLPCVLFATYK